jgi:Raf kinase inhibitor-like YbhB/YbcL family protein
MMLRFWAVAGLATTALWATTAAGCKKSASPQGGPGRQAGPSEQKGAAAMAITVRSPAFGSGERIPQRHSGDGEDVSPQLSWTGMPDAVRELALICDDPDAPTPQPWVHWVIYRIPANVTELPENVAKTERPAQPAGAVQGKNSWKRIGYNGPAPPPGHGVHHYHFKVYALDKPLDSGAGLDKSELLAAMEGHVIAEGELIGTYQR